MYADRVEATARRSVKERLNGSVVDDSVRRRPVTGKRQREDDKWKHDLLEDGPSLSSHKHDGRDLRLKLQKKSTQQLPQSRVAHDLREKLSGSMHTHPINYDTPKPKMKPEPEASKTTRKSAIEVPAPESTKVTNLAVRKKTQQKADTVDGFLQSLGLEKYLIAFQAEEVDMTALEHMTDEDLKDMGIPMGPRKKILLSLSSRA